MSTTRYICEGDLPDDEIYAAMNSGTLECWRIDAEGRQWFRQVDRTIYGVGRDFDDFGDIDGYDIDDGGFDDD